MSIFVLEGSNGSGKSTVAKIISEIYDINSIKSVPDWFRKYIEFARRCPLEIQKEIYKIGHDAIFFGCSDTENYIMDRFIYSTIIRINYELHISVEDTINEILEYSNIPTIVFILKSDINEVRRRLKNRGNMIFNYEFYCYENEIYDKLSKKSDILYLIDNNKNINYTVESIYDVINSKVKIRRRSINE